jgi:hypothetical protein
VQEEARAVAAEEFGEHVLRLPGAALHVDRLEDRHRVFEQELGVVGASASRSLLRRRRRRRGACEAAAAIAVVGGGRCGRWWSGRGAAGKELEYLELATDPLAGAGDKVWV